MLLSVSLHLCHYLFLCKKAHFFLTSAVLVEPFSFFLYFPENSVVEKGAIEIGGGGEGGER